MWPMMESINDWGYSFCNWGPNFGPGSWFLGWLFPLLFWGTICFLIFSLVKSIFKRQPAIEQDSALELLRKRFANGEISEEEYLSMKAALSS